MNICSRCGKVIDDVAIKIATSYHPYQISSQGVLIPLNNFIESTSEFLCADCFEKYSKCIESLNEEFEGRYFASMVDIVEDVCYDENN